MQDARFHPGTARIQPRWRLASNGFSAGEAECFTRLALAGLRRGGAAADTTRSFSEMRFLGIRSFGTPRVDCFSFILADLTKRPYLNFLSISLQEWRPRGLLHWIRRRPLGPGMVRTQEFISSSFCSRSRRVVLAEHAGPRPPARARHSERTEQSTERVQMAAWPAWLSQKSLSNSRPPSASITSPITIASAGARQRVAALLAARRFHESALAQHAQDLGGIRGGDAFRLADLRNGQAPPAKPA